MKVFISWSGTTSHRIALILRDWLLTVIHAIDPWVSSEDIKKGDRWSAQLAKQLDETSYGIICITPTNVQSPWLNFEAGALSRTIERSRVFPFLFGMSPSELKGPLAQFQITTFDKEDVRKLVKSLNQALAPSKIPPDRLHRMFEISWPSLQIAINNIDIPQPPTNHLTEVTSSQKPSTNMSGLDISAAEVEVLRALVQKRQSTLAEIIYATEFPIMKTEHCLERLASHEYAYQVTGRDLWGIKRKGTDLLIDSDLI